MVRSRTWWWCWFIQITKPNHEIPWNNDMVKKCTILWSIRWHFLNQIFSQHPIQNVRNVGNIGPKFDPVKLWMPNIVTVPDVPMTNTHNDYDPYQSKVFCISRRPKKSVVIIGIDPVGKFVPDSRSYLIQTVKRKIYIEPATRDWTPFLEQCP